MGDIMELAIETKKDIREVFENNAKVRDILLLSDEERKNSPDKSKAYYEEIEKIRTFGTSKFSANEVLECFDLDSLDYLYNQAVKKNDYARIYSEIIGNGSNPYTIEDEIGTLFDDSTESREELLKKDSNTMQQIGRYGASGFTAKEIINYYNSNKMDELHKKAEKKNMYKEVYYEVVYNTSTQTIK
jgi:hypothetical protein